LAVHGSGTLDVGEMKFLASIPEMPKRLVIHKKTPPPGRGGGFWGLPELQMRRNTAMPAETTSSSRPANPASGS
jgi:hypothetical protein